MTSGATTIFAKALWELLVVVLLVLAETFVEFLAWVPTFTCIGQLVLGSVIGGLVIAYCFI